MITEAIGSTETGFAGISFVSAMNDFYAAALAGGFARPGARPSRDTFDVAGGPLAIIVDDDAERAADLVRPTLALYIGGMGARGLNFHYEVFARMGYEAQARQIQDFYLAGDKKSAIAAVPAKLVEDVALIGPWAKIADEIQVSALAMPGPHDRDRSQGHLRRLTLRPRPQPSAVGTSSATSWCSLAIAWSNVASRDLRVRASWAR